ncbi:MAG: hypothetical protein HY787_18680 [Deltaproteobacteria bacterium]|nr:hypothetical protein [Deltaproteobacteria bacterium]
MRKYELFPTSPSPVRIDRFIEKRFKIVPVYEELPPGIIGLTEFGPNGVRKIAISESLAEESSRAAQHRINTTLAHEAGHGLLHAHLFALGEAPTLLFGEEVSPGKLMILCRGEAIEGLSGSGGKGYDGNWWEVQANMVIGPLLLPGKLVREALSSFLIKKGVMKIDCVDPSQREAAEKTLSDIFDVNPIVARIRLENLYPLNDGQIMF